MKPWRLRLALGLGILVVPAMGAPAASAQQVEIRAAPPPAPRPEVVRPPLQYETTRTPDADHYPQGVRVPYDPAFIEPFAGTYQTATSSGAYGLSGWTAPNPPVGAAVAGNRDVSGYFALGLSFTWDGPPPRPRRPAR